MLIRTLLPKALLIMTGFGVGLQIHTAPQGPTEQEIIEVLADYDVRHVPALPGYHYYGVTDFNSRIVYILDNQDANYKKRTVLHELTHITRRIRLEELSNNDEEEAAVGVIEEAEYRRLFLQ